jgi:endogenous inhibitor of DNA gyrase (YacG/DUF329 family)
MRMAADTVRCPACGAEIARDDAEDKGEDDPHARLTCPTCGAGIDPDGNLVHEPAVGP